MWGKAGVVADGLAGEKPGQTSKVAGGVARDHTTSLNYVNMTPKSSNLIRCAWPGNPLSIRYHDEEWGLPQHDDRVLFEFLILEGAQAGLSWDTVLQKRENYRAAFDGFNPLRIARYDRRKLASLLRNPGIIRNRLKIASAVSNAKAFLASRKSLVHSTVHLAVRGREAESERMALGAAGSGQHAGVRRHEQRP